MPAVHPFDFLDGAHWRAKPSGDELLDQILLEACRRVIISDIKANRI